MWLQSVFNAISEVEHNRPGLVQKVSNFNPDEEWDQEQWESYSYVAAAIVEPFVFPDGKSEDEDFYYSKTEDEGYGMVKGNITSIPNHDAWIRVIELVEVMGY